MMPPSLQAQQRHTPQQHGYHTHQPPQPAFTPQQQQQPAYQPRSSYNPFQQQAQAAFAPPHAAMQQQQAAPTSPVATFTPSPRAFPAGQGFQPSGPAAWAAAQAPRAQAAADAGLIPGCAAEGLRVTHGRPPAALLAWGFGGRSALCRPRPQVPALG
jgi:hypothetical protein